MSAVKKAYQTDFLFRSTSLFSLTCLNSVELWLRARPHHHTSVLVQHLVERLKPEHWRLLEQHINEYGFQITRSTIIHGSGCPYTFCQTSLYCPAGRMLELRQPQWNLLKVRPDGINSPLWYHIRLEQALGIVDLSYVFYLSDRKVTWPPAEREKSKTQQPNSGNTSQCLRILDFCCLVF